MFRVALLSFHGCPLARLGEKDSGGMNVYVLNLAQRLGGMGIYVDVYSRCHDERDPQIVQLGNKSRVIHIKAGPYNSTKDTLPDFIPEFVDNLRKFQRLENIEYDLIHSHYWLSGQVGMILKQLWNISHVTTFHTLSKIKMRSRVGQIESTLRIQTENSIMDESDAIVVTTEEEEEDLIWFYKTPRHKIEVIPAGVDIDMFYPGNKSDARDKLGLGNNKIILYVGRIEPLKGIDILLNAIKYMENKHDVSVFVVGGVSNSDPELNRLQSMAVELGIEDKVTFTGVLEHSILPDYYRAADVFVLPSHYESFGLVALEAMACGLPVIVSRVGGLKHIVNNGHTGYLIPWRCAEPFAQHIDMLLSNDALREAIGQSASDVASEMDWDMVAVKMAKFYYRLVGNSLKDVARV